MLPINDTILKYVKKWQNEIAPTPIYSLCRFHTVIYCRGRDGHPANPDEHAQNNEYINGVPKPAENCNVYEVPNV